MEKTMLIWYVIVGAVMAVVLADSVKAIMRRGSRKAVGRTHSHHQFITLGKERDMFFIPGDSLHSNGNDDFDE